MPPNKNCLTYNYEVTVLIKSLLQSLIHTCVAKWNTQTSALLTHRGCEIYGEIYALIKQMEQDDAGD